MGNEHTRTCVIASGDKVVLRDGLPSDLNSFIAWRTRGQWLDYDAPWEGGRISMTDEMKEKIKQAFLKGYVEELSSPRSRAIIATRENKPLGWVNRYGDRFPEACSVGINICEDEYLNKGYGTEALQLWVDYLFSNSDVHRIALATYSFNPRMIHVAEKVGFVHEGTDREIRKWDGKWIDRIHYGMLRSEWEERRKA